MRAAVVYGPNDVRVATVPEPAMGEYEALVQILACGVCTGTDTHIVSGAFPNLAPYPFVLGHESIGRVVETGPKVRYYKTGDLVLRPVVIRPRERLGEFGSMFGGLAEYGVVADARAIEEDTPRGEAPRIPHFADAQQVVPADFDPVLAGMFITFKETLSWTHQLGPLLNRSVLVLGTGPVGLCFVRVAKYLGADPVIVVGRRDERLELATRMGADAVVNVARQPLVSAVRDLTHGRGVDNVIEAVGSVELLDQAMRVVAEGGQIGIYGVPPVLQSQLDWSVAPRAWQVRVIRLGEGAVHKVALDLVRVGFIDLRSFVSHVIPLADVGEAFRLLEERLALKPTIVMETT